MLPSDRGTGRTWRSTANESPIGWPGVGYGSWPTISTFARDIGRSNARSTSGPAGRYVRPVPRSLGNIYKELHADVGIPAPGHGDLTAWSDQGVLLLNRVLTVEPGRPASHRGKGWEPITEAAITALVARGGPLVAVLWGKDAQTLQPLLGSTPVIASAHPSPMSADRGFFGSKPFSRANTLLLERGGEPVDWAL